MPKNQDIRQKYTRAHISNAVFYIPFIYYYVVRLGTFPKLLSWILIYIMPTAFYSAFPLIGSPIQFMVNYLLILIATFSLYEWGYIYNDTTAIKKERQPALRLYANNIEYFNHWKHLIFSSRLLYSVAAIIGVYFLRVSTYAILHISSSIALMCAIFALYNTLRNRYNVFLYPLLVCSRYVPFMFLAEHEWWVLLLLFVSFPLVNSIERFSMPIYRWPFVRTFIPNESSKTIFRACYYGLVLLIASPLMYLSGHSLLLLSPIIVLGIYRVSLLLWLRKHQPANYLNG